MAQAPLAPPALPAPSAVGRLRAVERPLPALPLPPASSQPCWILRSESLPHLPPPPALPEVAPQEHVLRGTVATPAEITVRVQAWLASGAPRLGLEFTGSWAGRVDVERSGPGRVRVRCQVRDARRLAGLARRLQQALGDAGLSVDGLSVGLGE